MASFTHIGAKVVLHVSCREASALGRREIGILALDCAWHWRPLEGFVLIKFAFKCKTVLSTKIVIVL